MSYVDEVRAFIDAILNGRPVSVTGVDGRIPVVMAAAASKSFKENRPVKLAEIAA